MGENLQMSFLESVLLGTIINRNRGDSQMFQSSFLPSVILVVNSIK